MENAWDVSFSDVSLCLASRDLFFQMGVYFGLTRKVFKVFVLNWRGFLSHSGKETYSTCGSLPQWLTFNKFACFFCHKKGDLTLVSRE